VECFKITIKCKLNLYSRLYFMFISTFKFKNLYFLNRLGRPFTELVEEKINVMLSGINIKLEINKY